MPCPACPAGQDEHRDDPCAAVRSSAELVMQRAELVTISQAAIEDAVAGLDAAALAALASPSSIFDRQLHFFDPEHPELTLQVRREGDCL